MVAQQNNFSFEEINSINKTICELYTRSLTILNEQSICPFAIEFMESIRDQIYFDKGDIMLYHFNDIEEKYEVCSFLQVGWDETDINKYVNRYVQIDTMLPFLTINKEIAMINRGVFSQKELKNSQIFHDFTEPAQTCNSIHANIILPENINMKAKLGFFRNNDRTGFSQKDLSIVKTYQPHLGNILANHLDNDLRLIDEYYKNICNNFHALGICILDEELKLIDANSTYRKYATETKTHNCISETDLTSEIKRLCYKLSVNSNQNSLGPIAVYTENHKYDVELYYYGTSNINGKYICMVISDNDIFNVKLIKLRNKFNLTGREYETLALALNEGLSTEEIASNLFISPSTVKKHISSAYQKLNISCLKQLIPMILTI